MAVALEHDPQVREAATRAQAAAGVRDHDDSEDADGNIPVLGAYSDGSVLAQGVEGSAAALVRVFGPDVSAPFGSHRLMLRCRQDGRSGRAW